MSDEQSLLLADSKTFYQDIGASLDATQDEILTSAVLSFYRIHGYDPPLQYGYLNPVDPSLFNSQRTNILAAFSTLYDPKLRATYDKFGDEMFELLAIHSHASRDHQTLIGFNALLKHVGYFTLSMAIFVSVAVGLLILYTAPTYHVITDLVILILVILLGVIVVFFTRVTTQYVRFSTSGEIITNGNLQQPTVEYDPSRDHLVRLYGKQLVFSWIPRFILLLSLAIAFILMALSLVMRFGWPTLGELTVFLLPTLLIGLGSSLTGVSSNSGFVIPHLDLLFDAVVLRIDSDLTNINADSREKIITTINILKAKCHFEAFLVPMAYFAAIITILFRNIDSAWMTTMVFIMSFIILMVIAKALIFVLKRQWSYSINANSVSA
ncbi:hypothetical protein GQ42DRAFT_29056 [Ramicandelaber brevisporus]|nr:hypothetical protein GQ42DRAFT_29056 [Ramicandelaber brevisporus]